MESILEYTASPSPYSPPASDPCHTTGTAAEATSPYPAPDPALGPTSYSPIGPQEYSPPAQYPSPPPQYPTATGQAPYEQPQGYGQRPAGYPPQPPPAYETVQYCALPSQPPQQQQQQQRPVVVVSARQQHHPVIAQQVPSYVGHIIFACVVFWCCNWLLGLIAFILAGQCIYLPLHVHWPLLIIGTWLSLAVLLDNLQAGK